jgi:hypothetical protein
VIVPPLSQTLIGAVLLGVVCGTASGIVTVLTGGTPVEVMRQSRCTITS